MKLRAIHLTNVRRFAGETASITGIGDGVTTVSAPNETGKSTFFDALHAVFFIDHKSQAQEVKSLQPYSKGPVQVAVDVEDAEGRQYRIEKKFIAQKAASVTDLGTGRIIAQEGEAGAWIDRLIGAGDGGPAGLLWVRQGMTGLEPAGNGAREKSERDKLRDARQTLMSSVAGQVDNITGGRRMDAIMKRCVADLEALATTKGPKAGGPWAEARAAVQTLEKEEEALSAPIDELAEALEERAQLRRKDEEDSDVARDEARRKQVSDAREAVEAARAHAGKVDEAGRMLRLAEIEVERAQESLEAARKAQEDAGKRKKAVATTQGALKEAQEHLDRKEADLGKAQERVDEAQKILDAITARAARKRAREDRQRLAGERKDMSERLEKAEELDKIRKGAAAKLEEIAITEEMMTRIEKLASERSTLIAQRDAAAAWFRVSYSGDQRLAISGKAIEAERDIPIVAESRVEVPGVGTMTLGPPASVDNARLEECTRDLEDLLREARAADVPAARVAIQTRRGAEGERARAEDAIKAYARDGIAVLRSAIEDLPKIEEEEGEEEISDPIDGIDADTAARQLSDAQGDRSSAQAVRNKAAEDLAAARTAARLAQEAFDEMPEVSDDEALTRLEETWQKAEDKRVEMGSSLETLRSADVVDLETAEAELERVQSVMDGATAAREMRRNRMAELDGLIRARAEDGIETRLAECRGELAEARARDARYEEEVAVLRELKGKLEVARSEARETYFEPVKRELLPLLKMLHPGAEVEMDPETMLPAKLSRDGDDEDLEALSGGAVEQVAILTRLAFARLYANQGRQVPIVLDDALVYSDDDRIVKMFTALTRVAKDQQIIVFSCRTRAFEDLGGTRPGIDRMPA
ncbi:DNA repair exonuclease SbcCD ATPase subunit [Roseovarius pacificus]|uniref:DNA repair exonuclease SbcCD ATPase subunit n=1 Tax=Roseovarius pacificus TaxID=337701 RepID=A0A1M7FVK9_9RHOB|nr:ATP-binding protein [Roseovarius pacificus]GGO59506.1 GTP-binding protein [Roseovarius pacificus]SHM08073.1 DNA repair exonuclease SbcCD ATPase subunit [Roseovarius pacificus]